MITGKRKSFIPGFENYLICENGNVYLLDHYYPEFDCYGILSKRIDRGGYYSIRLTRDKKAHTLLLHRILALCFIPNRGNKLFINHRDGNRLNNSLSNLEWCSASQNTRHAYEFGLIKPKGKQVVDMESGLVFKNAKKSSCYERFGLFNP